MFLNRRSLRLCALAAALFAVTLVFILGRSREAIKPSVDSASARVLVKRDLHYPVDSGRTATFDLYAPKDYLETHYPILIWIHGGGWRIGDKSDWLSANLAWHAAELGFVVFNINYRLNTPQQPAPYPAATDDVDSFARYLARHLDLAHATNLTRISLGGHSAGAHLALYEATNATAPFQYACVIDVAGVSDLNDPSLPAALKVYVDAFAPSAFERHQASPIRRLGSWRADQILIVHAADDPDVPIGQSISLGRALSSRSTPPLMHYVFPKHGGHNLASPVTNNALDEILRKDCR